MGERRKEDEATGPEDLAERAWRLRGRVQGVGFRWWTRKKALALGLEGWVRNEPDGSVSLHVRGGAREVEAMEQAVREGPPGARVGEAEETPPEIGDASGFDIRH